MRRSCCGPTAGFTERGAATCDEAIHILRQHDSPEDLIAALYERMLTASFLNELDIALSTTREGLRIAQAVGDKYWQGYHLVWMGSASVLQGDFDHALQCGEMGLSILRGLGNQWGLLFAYDLLGRASVGQGNFEKARQWFEQAGGLADLFDHVFSKAMRHVRLSELARLERDHSTARTHMEQALKIFWDGGYNWIAPVPLVYIAQISADQNDLDRAVEVLAAIDKYSVTFDQTDQTALSLREELEARLESDRFTAAWVRGQRRELSALVAELLAELGDEQAPE